MNKKRNDGIERLDCNEKDILELINKHGIRCEYGWKIPRERYLDFKNKATNKEYFKNEQD